MQKKYMEKYVLTEVVSLHRTMYNLISKHPRESTISVAVTRRGDSIPREKQVSHNDVIVGQ